MATTTDILQLQPLLFSIAYKMTGNVMDSEDIIQDVYSNWFQLSTSGVEEPKKYLAKAVTNRCISLIQKQRQLKKQYKGIYLPEPLIRTGKYEVETTQDLSFGFLLLLSKLSPLERAVFLLKEGFDFEYWELSQILELREDYCRQLYHRANDRLKENKKRFNPEPDHKQKLLQEYQQALETGNIEKFIHLLKKDITIYSDGGGKVSAALKPIVGRESCMKFILGMHKKSSHLVDIFPSLVNNSPGFIFYVKGTQVVISVMIMDEEDGVISDIYFMRNPDKIHINF